jgi:K+-transporting ATPase KdpF subunit
LATPFTDDVIENVIENVIAGLVALALVGYLVYALVRPERF